MKREREEKWVGKTAPIMAHHDSFAPFYINFFFVVALQVVFLHYTSM